MLPMSNGNIIHTLKTLYDYVEIVKYYITQTRIQKMVVNRKKVHLLLPFRLEKTQNFHVALRNKLSL